jgi:cell division protease FtsH
MRHTSPETEQLIDQEIRTIVEGARDRALGLLREQEAALHQIAQVLQEKEVIDGEEISRLVANS